MKPSDRAFDLLADLARLLKKHKREAFAELAEMMADGMAPAHVARLLGLLAEERQASQVIADRVELVWSGLDLENCSLFPKKVESGQQATFSGRGAKAFSDDAR